MLNLNKNSYNFHNSIILSNTNSKAFVLSLHFSNYFKTLLYRKNILVTQLNLNFNSNRIDLCIHLYFRKKKLIKFRNFKLSKKFYIIKNNIIFDILKDLKLFFGNNTFNIKLKVLNKLIIFPFFFKFLKKKIKFFKKSLFERRFNLYFDFIKLAVLYQTSQITLDSFLLVLGEIFQRLVKKKHGQFLKLIKVIFKDIFLKYKTKNLYNEIKGARFIISGKIKGKLRAKITSIYFGSIPISTFSKNIQFSKIDVYTSYGTYGIKLWVYQQMNVKKNFDKILSKIRFIKRKRFFLSKKIKKFNKKSKRL
jgi:hypothetical protein